MLQIGDKSGTTAIESAQPKRQIMPPQGLRHRGSVACNSRQKRSVLTQRVLRSHQRMLGGGVGVAECLSKLTQEAHVVLKQPTDVGNSVAYHRETFDAEPEREARHFIGVVPHRLEHRRINHSGPANF